MQSYLNDSTETEISFFCLITLTNFFPRLKHFICHSSSTRSNPAVVFHHTANPIDLRLNGIPFGVESTEKDPKEDQ